jgi:inorganic triphosphatase YgiF
MNERDREIEVALILCDDDAELLAQRIAALDRLDGFQLVTASSQTIRDSYFDSPDSRLAAAHLALRLRELDGNAWLGLKGRPREEIGVLTDRLEIEARWSGSALKRIARELSSQGVVLNFPENDSEAGPTGQLLAAGLVLRQQRETWRDRRLVIDTGRDSEPVAELAIDLVAFDIDGVPVVVREVEIEAMSREAAPAVERIVDALYAKFPDRLRRWPYPKLLTGEGIGVLKEMADFADLLEPNGLLRPAGYHRLDQVLKADFR